MEPETTLCAPLVHSLRVQILAMVNESPMSPSQFVERGFMPALHYRHYSQALSLASYHFRRLEETGCLKIIETFPVRGTVEHIYAGLSHLEPSEDGRRELPVAERARLNRISMQGLIARADLAVRAGTFDGRVECHLDWAAISVSEEGWSRLQSILNRAQREIDELGKEAREEARRTGDDMARIDATVALLAFETPQDLKVPLD
jgi:hypothetical protein